MDPYIRSDRILSHRIHGAGIFAGSLDPITMESILLWLRKITPQYSIFDPQILDELPYSLRLDEKTFPPFNLHQILTHFHVFRVF